MGRFLMSGAVLFGLLLALPVSLAAQACDWCDNGEYQGEEAHQFGFTLGEEFCCGAPGQAECHYDYAVAGKCSEEHAYCGQGHECPPALAENAADAVQAALDVESPALLQKAFSEFAQQLRVEGPLARINVVGCNGSSTALIDLPPWVSSRILAGALSNAPGARGPTLLHQGPEAE